MALSLFSDIPGHGHISPDLTVIVIWCLLNYAGSRPNMFKKKRRLMFFWSRTVSGLFKHCWKTCSYQRQHHSQNKMNAFDIKNNTLWAIYQLWGKKQQGVSKTDWTTEKEKERERDGKIFYTSKNYWSNPTQARGCTTGSNKPDKWMPKEVISLIIMLKCDTDKVNC